MNHRICISGIGIISPIGTGRENFWNALEAGRDGVSEVDLFDSSAVPSRMGAMAEGFDPVEMLGKKGLKYIDRASRFAIGASALALADAGVVPAEEDAHRRGIILGTVFGGLSSLKDFNRERVLDGAKWVSPLKFPNTPINAPSYQIPIRYQMRRINVTISSGIPSGLDTIGYAMLLMQRMPDSLLLCGGVDELSYWAYHSSSFLNLLAGGSGEEISCPFDQRRNGYILGEGSALLALETEQQLRERGGKNLASILGYGSAFAPESKDLHSRVRAVLSAIRSAVEKSKIAPEQIDFIAASANSGRDIDSIEHQAIHQYFGERASTIPVTAIKSMIGETFASSGIMQVAAAVLALQKGIVAPTLHLKYPEFKLNIAPETRMTTGIRYALVNSIDLFGNASCLVLGPGLRD